jgi:thiamine monophosphate kinase
MGALSGGDDYRLCFTAAPCHARYCVAIIWVISTASVAYVEGEGVLVVDQYGVPCEEQGNTSNGFRHF